MNIIKEDAFRKELKKGLSGGFLFFGDEDYMKGFDLRASRAAVCPDETFAIFNDIRIDAMDYSAGALLDALIPPPMMTEQKIVTVSGLNISGPSAAHCRSLHPEAMNSVMTFMKNLAPSLPRFPVSSK